VLADFCMNGFACKGGGVTDAAAGFASTGGGATGASKAGRVTGRPCTGGVHGASGVADCGNGGGRFEAGLRIGFGGGDDGIADAGRRIGAGGAEAGAALLADGATLALSSGGRLRFGGGGGWLTFGRACAIAAGAWLGTGR